MVRGGLFVLVAVLCAVIAWLLIGHRERWVVYYGPDTPLKQFKNFDVIVFESGLHPPIAPLKAQNKTVLGYISLGLADPYHGYADIYEEKHLLLPPDPLLNGLKVIDVRKPEWKEYVIGTLIPALLAQGFDGIMMDTLDNVTWPEEQSPRKYSGMQKAAAQMVRDIRQHFPGIKIMMNRGFEILPAVVSSIDMVIAESIYTNIDPVTKQLVVVPEDIYEHYANILKNAQKQSNNLKVYTIDYWPQDDARGIERIYAAQRHTGFIPYVSTQDLQKVYIEQ